MNFKHKNKNDMPLNLYNKILLIGVGSMAFFGLKRDFTTCFTTYFTTSFSLRDEKAIYGVCMLMLKT